MRLPVKIGTRGSPLARAQTEEVCNRLIETHPALAAPGAIQVELIKTSGDKFADRPLADIGGKGLFTKEIEEALIAGRIDLAVHSMKDMPTWLPEGLEIAVILPREDPRDVLIAPVAKSLADLPKGARVGTASLRRRAQLLLCRPDLKIGMLRGNVATRVRKVTDGQFDATLLALAGLRRLGAEEHIAAVLEPEEMLPAVAQGAMGVECRIDDVSTREMLTPLDHKESAIRVRAERALLAMLDGSCRTPIAALAELADGGRLKLRALIARPDGSACHRAAGEGAVADAEDIGTDVGAELKAAGGPGFFDA